jgi:hypothetical protein
MVAPQPAPQAGPTRDKLNMLLAQLWQQTGDQSILDYINSGWTTPVSPKVQPQVSRIVGRQVPAIGQVPAGPVAPQNGPAVPPQYGPQPPAGPQAVAGPPSLAQSSNQVWPDPPPQATGTGYQGGAQAVPDPNAFPVGGKGGSFFNAPAPAGGGYNPPANQQGSGGYNNETTPASVGLMPGAFAAAATNAAQRGNAAVAQTGGSRPGGGSTVNPPAPFTATGQNPLTTPLAGPVGSIDPNSTPGEIGYTAAQGGDQNALDAILASMLQKYGIDVTHPGLYTANIVKTLAPYLNTFMKYAGLSDMQPTAGRLRGLADQFAGMIGSADTMGQIRGFAQQALPGLQGMLANPAGPLAQPANQQGILNDFLGMLTAGANPIQQSYQQGLLNNANLGYQIDQTVNGKQGDFLTYLRNNAAKTPGSDLLAQIIGASR